MEFFIRHHNRNYDTWERLIRLRNLCSERCLSLITILFSCIINNYLIRSNQMQNISGSRVCLTMTWWRWFSSTKPKRQGLGCNMITLLVACLFLMLRISTLILVGQYLVHCPHFIFLAHLYNPMMKYWIEPHNIFMDWTYKTLLEMSGELC